MRRLFTVTFVATVIISLGGWFWLLADLLRWLIIKL
jgi:hypothetical protein